jgi:N6-L-threonylcarbamoyladenine synthase
MALDLGRPLFVPPLAWCVDNAAMIAHLGARQLAAGRNILDLAAEARPRWPVEEPQDFT